MSTVTESTPAVPSSAPIALEIARVRKWKAPIVLSFFTLVSLILFVVFARPGITTFRLATEADFFQLPAIEANAAVVGTVVTALLFAITAFSIVQLVRAERTPLWVISIYAVLFVYAFLA